MTLRAIAAVAQVRLKQVCVVFGHRPDLCPCENWNIDVASDDVVTSNEHCGEKRVAGLPGEIQLPLRRPLTSAPDGRDFKTIPVKSYLRNSVFAVTQELSIQEVRYALSLTAVCVYTAGIFEVRRNLTSPVAISRAGRSIGLMRGVSS